MAVPITGLARASEVTPNSVDSEHTDPSGRPGPEISVLLMASRHRAFVSDAIDSVHRQTTDPKRYELIVIHDYDDATLDRSVEVVGGRQVRVETHDIGAAIGAGIRSSRGTILTFLDDDDRYLPGRLAFVLDSFQRIDDLGFLKNGFVVIDAKGQPQPHHPFRSHQRRNAGHVGPVVLRGKDRVDQLRRLPELGVGFNSSSMAARRDLVVDFLRQVDLSDFRLLDELIFFAALVSGRSLCFDPTILTEYRIHSRNVSFGSQEDRLSRRAAFSAAFLPSYARLANAVRTYGLGPISDEAEGLLRVQAAYSALRDPTTPRTTFLRLRHSLDELRATYIVRSESRLYEALWLFSLTPRLGRWVYNRRIAALDA